MRVLFLSSWFPYPPDNGSKIRVFHLLRALGKEHDVHLVAFCFGTALPEFESQLTTICRSVDTIDLDPFEKNRTNAFRRFISVEPVVNKPILEMAHLVEDILASNEFDVVIASGEAMASYALHAGKVVSKVLEEHNSFSRLMYDRFQGSDTSWQKIRNWVSYQKTRRYERETFALFDLVTMVSKQDKVFSEQYLHKTDVQIEVVPNGVDCQFNRPGLASPVPGRLVYSGALTFSANFDAMEYFLQEIYPVIKRKVPSVSLVITGSNEGVEIEQLALDESVCLTGYVEDIRLEVASAMALVAPLRVAGGSRLKILEAMALGTPVVATTKGAEGLDIAAGKELLTADNPTEFAAQTVRLLLEEDLRRRISNNGRRIVETQYDWQPIGREFTDLIEKTRCSVQP